MDIENKDTGEKTHIDSPQFPDNGQWSDPELIEAPRIRVKDTGWIYKAVQINFDSKYVTFVIDQEVSWLDDHGQTVTYKPGQICLKPFSEIEIE